MSGLTEAQQFKLDFSEWEWRMVFLEDCPQSEVEEIKEAIRDAWHEPERKAYWVGRVRDEAEFSRELKRMGKECEQRMKARCRLDREGAK